MENNDNIALSLGVQIIPISQLIRKESFMVTVYKSWCITA